MHSRGTIYAFVLKYVTVGVALELDLALLYDRGGRPDQENSFQPVVKVGLRLEFINFIVENFF